MLAQDITKIVQAMAESISDIKRQGKVFLSRENNSLCISINSNYEITFNKDDKSWKMNIEDGLGRVVRSYEILSDSPEHEQLNIILDRLEAKSGNATLVLKYLNESEN